MVDGQKHSPEVLYKKMLYKMFSCEYREIF